LLHSSHRGDKWAKIKHLNRAARSKKTKKASFKKGQVLKNEKGQIKAKFPAKKNC